MRFFSSRPASKYSIRTARSRTRFISSKRRPKVMRAITNSTPGALFDAIVRLLCHSLIDDLLSECDDNFVIRGTLRTVFVKLPFEASVGVVERGDRRNHAPHIDAEELAADVAQLEHHAHWSALARSLIER